MGPGDSPGPRFPSVLPEEEERCSSREGYDRDRSSDGQSDGESFAVASGAVIGRGLVLEEHSIGGEVVGLEHDLSVHQRGIHVLSDIAVDEVDLYDLSFGHGLAERYGYLRLSIGERRPRQRYLDDQLGIGHFGTVLRDRGRQCDGVSGDGVGP